MPHNLFGDAVRSQRALLGLKQKDVAERCNICVATVSLIETSGATHRTPRLDTALKLGNLLEIPTPETVLRWAHELVECSHEKTALEEALLSINAVETLKGLLSDS